MSLQNNVGNEIKTDSGSATVKGGTIGGLIGLGIGTAAVVGASRRYHSFRALSVPFRAFLVTSSGSFVGA